MSGMKIINGIRVRADDVGRFTPDPTPDPAPDPAPVSTKIAKNK